MSNWMILITIIMFVILGMITIPALTYMMTKCYFDARNKSMYEFHKFLTFDSKEKDDA